MATRPAFSGDELAALREHGFVIFADRVIYDAQPPMSDVAIKKVEKQCTGPLPEALLALWRTTAGGSLDYDLALPMGGSFESLSWSELFYNGSDRYHDLQGWIDHELGLQPKRKKLRALPIGGFEYAQRIYLIVDPGPRHGAVVAWSEALPGWPHRLQEDAVGLVGADLYGAFAALSLAEDPRTSTLDYAQGSALLDEIEGRVDEGLDRRLADRLIAFYVRAVTDWNALLASGALRKDPTLGRRGLAAAIRRKDVAFIRKLAPRVALDQPVAGSALPVEAALAIGYFDVAAVLLEAGAPVPARALESIDAKAPREVVKSLLGRGAVPTIAAIVACAMHGARPAANLIADAYAARHRDLATGFAKARTKELAKLRKDLKAIRAGKLGHYAGEKGVSRWIDNLDTFELAERGRARR